MFRGADAVQRGGRQHRRPRFREWSADPARSENLCMRGISMRENREARRLPVGVDDAPPSWIAGWRVDARESDSCVVPAKPANKAGVPAAELVEGRRLDEGNTGQQNALRTQSREGRVSSALDRVRRVAMKDRDARFTALLHHVNVDRLRAAYRALSPTAAAGVDEVTWQDYGNDLEGSLRDLHARVQRGAYRAKPSRRVYIAKADGRLRSLGVAAFGGQDRPARRRRGRERRLRGGFPRLLVRVSTGARPA